MPVEDGLVGHLHVPASALMMVTSPSASKSTRSGAGARTVFTSAGSSGGSDLDLLAGSAEIKAIARLLGWLAVCVGCFSPRMREGS